jgi:drug/metabolite transporter (DMT)-like permease
MTSNEWALLLVLSVLWGGAFFFTGVVLRELPPLTVLALRVGLAALVLLGALRVLGLRLPRDAGAWRAFLIMGVINCALPFFLLIWSQTTIPTGLAAILNATTPLSTAIVAHFLTSDEKITANRLAGVLIGFAGVATMIGPAAFAGWSAGLLAHLAAIGATVSYAFGSVYGRNLKRLGIAPLLSATGQLIVATLVAAPVALIVDRPWLLPMPGVVTWLAIIAFAGLSTSLAFVIYFRLLASAGATNIVLVTLLIPVSAILLGVLVLGERLDAREFAGMALIALGLVAIDGRLWAGLRTRLQSR